MTVLFAGIGGVLASTTYREQDAPRFIPGTIRHFPDSLLSFTAYLTGISATMAAQAVLIIILGATHVHFRRLNKLSKEGRLGAPLEGRPGFYYTL
jgi:hypothetical protein